ncbi:T-cell surface glycoprotein CD4 [Dissostichus eleginoides]|uniref:T-cell surface glycoprotein CD4 n=1 Tax=Dissostichus eleginoides TaxID=100907 RepID=A0AAD9FAX6_DISEL|nr:T-cell surface glycoprotein CD4 [Dissostichus eleginoides]
MRIFILLLLLLAVLTSTTGAVEVVYAQIGGTVTLNPPKDLKSHYMYWKKDKDSSDYLASLNPMGNKIWKIKDEAWKNISSWSPLIIKNIQQEHFRTFFLKLMLPSANPTFYEYEIRKLTVSVDPSSPVLPGEKVTLSCSAETPRGEIIKWMNPRGVRNLLNPFTFSASMRDNGPWSCMVTDGQSKSQVNVSVTVLDLSPALSRPQYTSTSSPLTVPCSLLPLISWDQIKAKGFRKLHWSFIPTPGSVPQTLFSLSAEGLLTWKPNQNKGLLQPGTNLKKGDLSLGRNRGTEDDAGEYICALEFENGVRLNRGVHVKLLQIVSSTGTELISGQQLNLTCGLEQPLTSDLHLKWFPPKQTTLSDPRPSSPLIIPAVSTADAGKWRCELWQNNTKLTSAEITLEIVPWLSVWMLVVICSVTVIIILVFILAFILCRRRQQKMRHLRRRLCQCKHPKPKGFYRT